MSLLTEDEGSRDTIANHLSYRIIGSQIQVAGWTTYSVLIWSLKFSMLVFYIRLTVCLRLPLAINHPYSVTNNALSRQDWADAIASASILGLPSSSGPS